MSSWVEFRTDGLFSYDLEMLEILLTYSVRLVGSVQFIDGRTLGRCVSDEKSRKSSSHG